MLAERSLAVIALYYRSFAFIEKMIANVRFHHHFLALLALIASVIAIIVKLFVNEFEVSHLG